jgi:hypothetical protein
VYILTKKKKKKIFDYSESLVKDVVLPVAAATTITMAPLAVLGYLVYLTDKNR